MNYTPEKTPARLALDKIESSASTVAGSASYIARTLNASHATLWGLPDAVLNETLAVIGKDRVDQLLSDHYAFGTVANQILSRTDLEERVIVVAGRELQLTDGVYSVVPIPEPEPEPLPAES